MDLNYYDNLNDAEDYQKFINNIHKPLQNELEVLQYSKLLQEQIKESNFFDPNEEAQKIFSGYYLNIHESLNILREFHDNVPNPFKNFHEEAIEYVRFLQQQNKESCEQINRNNLLPTGSYGTDNFETSSSSNCSLFIVTDDEQETKNSQVAKKPEITKRKRGRPRKTDCQKLDVKPGVSAKRSRLNTRAAEKSSKKLLMESMTNTSPDPENFDLIYPNLSPIIPNPVHYSSPNKLSTSQTFCDPDEHSQLLQSLKNQYDDSIFVENGKTFYPILTNDDFKDLSYDLEDEIINNMIIQKQIFFPEQSSSHLHMLLFFKNEIDDFSNHTKS